MVKVAIVGSREYPDLDRVYRYVFGIAAKHPDAWIVSGGARGVDITAEEAAYRAGLVVISFRPFGWRSYDHDQERFRVAKVVYSKANTQSFPSRTRWPKALEMSVEPDSWDSYRDAAFARNELIVQASDLVVAFPVDRPGGTTNTINHAHRLDKPLYEYEMAL